MRRLCIPSDLQDTFEEAIDRHSLANVLDALSEICAGKATHIQENWQDTNLANRWEAIARLLATAEEKAHGL